MVQLERASNYLRNENKADIDIEHSQKQVCAKIKLCWYKEQCLVTTSNLGLAYNFNSYIYNWNEVF